MNPSLTIAIALLTGIVTQGVAIHLRVPGIVLLLAAGTLLGPDGAGIVQPASLGPALGTLTGFAVAIILFEGGLSLQAVRLRKQARPIRQLITVGAIVTLAGGTLCARFFMDWDWRTSVLFGTLVIVTGPTVITPLLRRLKVKHVVGSVLESEGVLVDAVGAVVATVALEVALSPHETSWLRGLAFVGTRLGFGAAAGLAGGLLMAALFRLRDLVPDGIENVLVLACTVALFQVANTIMPESGIAAVVVAGIVVGNADLAVGRDLAEFKEQLTLLFIGMLFVLLSADVRLADVWDLGAGGWITVAVLLFVVRPLTAAAGTFGSTLTLRERVFIGWIGPRGIVAAAVASLFASEFSRHGLEGGRELRGLVFLVIASSVLFSGLTGGFAARVLGLRRRRDWGWVILGANELARIVATVLRAGEKDVVCIDTNPQSCISTERTGVRVFMGNGLQERTLYRAEIDTREGALGLTPNEAINLVFLQRAAHEGGLKRLALALKDAAAPVTPDIAHKAGAEILFGAPQDVDLWSVRVCRQLVAVERWRYDGAEGELSAEALAGRPLLAKKALLMTLRRGTFETPVTDRTKLREGDEVTWMLYTEGVEDLKAALRIAGWTHLEPLELPGVGSCCEPPPGAGRATA